MSNVALTGDGYELYYAEKLWQLVPEVYRNEDSSGAFRQIVELIGEQAAVSRRSIDRLWEDQHIETCDDWAVPYIGDLVGARLVSATDRRARRVEVGNAIRFRRRRGTPELLDTLVRSISGWDAVLEEGFRRLARTRHRLDPLPAGDGLFTTTVSGGTADLRNPAGAELSDSPFDEYFHTLDTRLLRGRDGRFGIRKLNFHLYRLRAFEMNDTDPFEIPAAGEVLRTFTFDPSGRDVPLFVNGEGAGIDDKRELLHPNAVCVDRLEWQVTQPMRCRLLGHDAYRITDSHIADLESLANPPLAVDLNALGRLRGVRFDSEPAMRWRLQEFGSAIGPTPPDWYVELVALSLVTETGKSQLYPAQAAVETFSAHRISAADLSVLECHPTPAGELARLAINPEHGRFASSPSDQPADFDPLVARYHYGFSARLGAGPYPRPAIDHIPSLTATGGLVPDGGVLRDDGLLFSDNRTYELTIRAGLTVVDGAAITVGPQRRPFVRLRGRNSAPTQPELRPREPRQEFMIDGGWYSGQDPNGQIATGDTFDLTIDGASANDENEFDFERLEIRYATLDPGGERADGGTIPPLRLFVRSRVKTLVIRNSITGPIAVEKEDEDDPSVIDELIICDSIVDASQTAAGVAVSSLFGRVSIESSTVFGDVQASVLHCSDSIIDGRVRVVNNQEGCFRFSATRSGPDVRLPPRYRDHVGRIPPSVFNSRRFGDPQYAQLSVVAPEDVAAGAENGSEMGAFSHLLNPIRLRSIRTKVDEFGPAGQLAQYLFEGDRAAESILQLGPMSPEPPEAETPAPPDPGETIPLPPPPPPSPLPTTCEQDEPVPEPEPESPTVEALIRLANADINGAPEFWRGVDWLPGLNPAIDPSAPALAGIPLDKVDHVLEYDARFGTMPEEQGWIPANERTAAFYTLTDHSLRFGRRTEAPAFYTLEPELRGGAPEQIHAYACVLIAQAPSPDQRDKGQSFELQFLTNQAGETPRGMRAGWSRTASGSIFRYLNLRSGALSQAPPQPHDGLLNTWMATSLQADFRSEHTLMSLANEVDHTQLADFGRGAGVRGNATLRALFGFTRPGGQAEGRIRNFVVSAPGRFLRVWMRAGTPVDRPTLRLSFVVDGEAKGTARIAVRYTDNPDRQPQQIPDTRADATLSPNAGALSTVDIPLEAARAGHHLLMTIERDFRHAEDNLRTTIRLVAAKLMAQGGSP